MRYVWRHGNLPILLLTLSGFMTACFDSEMEWKELNPEASATPSPSASAETTSTIAATTTTTSTISATPSPSPSPSATISAFIWTGAGGDAFWNTATNWLGGAVPGPSDTAVFNSTCSTTCNVTISNITTVGGISMDSTYTGTITQIAAMNLTIGSSGFTLAGGTFNGSSASITINTGSLVVQGGTFTGGSGNITLNGGALQISSGSFASSTGLLTFSAVTAGAVFAQTGGSFAHNGGSVKFTSSTANTYTINASSVDFYGLALSGGAVAGGPEVIWEIIGGSTINTVGDFAFGRVDGEATGFIKINNGSLTAKGGVRVYPGAQGGSGTVVFGSTTNQTYTWEAGTATSDRLPNVMVNMNTSALTLTPNTGTTQFACQNFNLSQGAFTAPTGSMLVFGEFLVNAGSTTFAHNTGAVTLFHNTTGTYEIAVPAGFAFNHLNLTAGTDTCCSHPLITWNNTNGGTIVVNGNFELKKSIPFTYGQPKINGGTIQIKGNMTVGAESTGGSAAITFAGTNIQTYTNAGGTNPAGNWSISKAGGKVVLASSLALVGTTKYFDIYGGGILDLAGYNITGNYNVSFSANTTLRMLGNESISWSSFSSGGPTFVSEFYGNGTYTLATNVPYRTIRFNGTGTWTLGSGISPDTLELNSGTLNGSNKLIYIYASWIKAGGTFTPGTSTVEFFGSSNHTISGNTTFYNFKRILPAGATTGTTLTFSSGSTQTVTNQLTLQGLSSGNRLLLRSSVSATNWSITPPTGGRTVDYVDVMDSYCTDATTLITAGPAAGSVCSGACTNWTWL